MGCCGCFDFLRKRCKFRCWCATPCHPSRENLLDDDIQDSYSQYGSLENGDFPDFLHEIDQPSGRRSLKHPEEIILSRAQSGLICRGVPVKETRKAVLSEDEDGNKMVNEYVRLRKIGSGSYAKVVLYRSTVDEKLYAIKVFHKSQLMKQRVSPSETAMNDVLREVSIMKILDHPNIVNLIEVIDDPDVDKFYMVLEYVEFKMTCEENKGLEETLSRKYMRDIVAGVLYLHAHKVIHLDIKPDNLLITSNGRVKIGDFGVSQVFEDDDDLLRRSPGTPVFTAPECCIASEFHGRSADIWAVGVTLYCMVTGSYPFMGDSLQDTYDKITNDPVNIPPDLNPLLADLMEKLLCKDPAKRITLQAVAEHPWVLGDEGPIPEYPCFCGYKRNILEHHQMPSTQLF